MDSIAHEQGESCGNAALRSDIQIISSGLRVSLRFDNLSVLGSEKFDEFKKGEKISYAFRLVFQSFEKTLTDGEVNTVMQAVAKSVEKKGWGVR